MDQETDAIKAVKARLAGKKPKPRPAATEESIAEDIGKAMTGELTPAVKPSPAPVAEYEAEAEEAQFDFSEDFQTKIAALILRDERFYRRIDGLVKPAHFENRAEAILVGLVMKHFDEYGQLPTMESGVWAEILKRATRDRIIRDDDRREVVDKFRLIKKHSLSGANFVVDKLAEFAKNQEISKAIHESIDLLQRGEYDSIEKAFSKAFNMGAARDYEELDYWENIEERTQRRKDKASGLIKPNGIPTGVKKIDQLLFHKGLGRKELTVIMGGAKKGKSMGLGDLAARFALQGYNVLYATLEVSLDIIADRLDANITKTEMNSLEDNIHSVHDDISGKKSGGAGEFKICEFPSGQLTCKELKRVIERYRTEGIKFDVIVTDYADIMAPDIYTPNDIENSKQVWLGLRAIAQVEDCVMLTATQTNRSGFKSVTAKADDVAEDFNKIRIADLVFSINRTDEERDRGEARLYFAASRNQAGEFSVTIKQNLARMSFIDGVVEVS